jgi:hypothetical protein
MRCASGQDGGRCYHAGDGGGLPARRNGPACDGSFISTLRWACTVRPSRSAWSGGTLEMEVPVRLCRLPGAVFLPHSRRTFRARCAERRPASTGGARVDGGTPGSHVAGTREQAEGDEGEHEVGYLPFDRGLGVADPWRGGAGRRWYGISWRGYTTISAPFY